MATKADMRAAAIALLRRPQVLAGAAFLATGAAIVTNALFLQAGPHPSPFSFAHERAAARIAAHSDELVREVQDALKQLGYYSGPLDGLSGPQTHAAIEAFRLRSGFDGAADPGLELLAALRSASRLDLAPVPTEVVAIPSQELVSALPAESAPPAAQPDPTVAAVQDALARAAYGPLVADGLPGPATRDAVMRFQRDHDLPVTGEITDALVVELRAAGALGGG
jgi:peptidoglycan hydrolase-like protein with peptidoglycan-binding domain